ncbi:MAG: VCBS repeat-containing protein, partial [Rhizobiales bacterium]|nr:VCBS repeat-containing protein [Hyphomicrobiales bacterium]
MDGYEDLLVTTGHWFDTQDLDADERIAAMGPFARGQVGRKVLLYPPLPLPKKAYRNRGDLTFEEASDAWGFNQVGISQGLALADLDNDGDLDLAVNNLNAPAGIYRNDSPAPRVAVRLRGTAPNTQGIGARILVMGGPAAQSQEVIAGGHYLSGSEPLRVFAAGAPTKELTIEVRWRDGRTNRVDHLAPDRIYTITEGSWPLSTPAQADRPARSVGGPWFQDVSALLGHVHHEDAFDDFARQPLLPRRLSQLGPGVCWSDLDGDGHDDLIIGSGKGGRLAVFRNDGQGGFARASSPPLDQPAARDQTGLVIWPGVALPALLIGSANYEPGLADGPAVRRWTWGQPALDDSLPALPASTGPLAVADYDGDGFLDLFVGGRVVAGRYPEPAASFLFRQVAGALRLDEENSKALARIGLVSGAVFSDLDGDGGPELLLACEWGPIHILRWRDARFR